MGYFIYFFYKQVFPDSNYFVFQHEYENKIDTASFNEAADADYEELDNQIHTESNIIKSRIERNVKNLTKHQRIKRIRRGTVNEIRVRRSADDEDELNKLKKEPSVCLQHSLDIILNIK